jgi:hypothetical protein
MLIRVLLLLSGFFISIFDANAQLYYNETCRNATGALQLNGGAVYTGNDVTDPAGDGWLRLTKTEQYQLGYVKLAQTFPSAMGAIVEFDFKTWTNQTRSVADGFSVFLFDGDLDSTFQIGSDGGKLGYVDMRPAYLGVGIDDIGYFSAPNHTYNGPERRRHSIAVADAEFYYVTGTADSLGTKTLLSYTTQTSMRPNDNLFYRWVRIELEPLTGGIEGMSVTVLLKTVSGGAYGHHTGNCSRRTVDARAVRTGICRMCRSSGCLSRSARRHYPHTR